MNMEMPPSSPTSPWHTAKAHTGLVSVRSGAVQISATISGQLRPSSNPCPPVVIMISGIGGVAAEFVAVAELVDTFARVLRFDRAGYGDSTHQIQQRTSISLAEAVEDLSLVLAAIELPPPYILVGQSFGGVFAREFLHQRGSAEVSGMVLIDSFPINPSQGIIRAPFLIDTLCADTPFEVVNGLTANSVLTSEQTTQAATDLAKAAANGTIMAELKTAPENGSSINSAQQMTTTLGDNGLIKDISYTASPSWQGRLSIVIGDFPRDLEAALKFGRNRGHGDEQLYNKAEELLSLMNSTAAKFQKAQAGLTNGDVHVRVATGTGRTHSLHLTRPDIVAEEVRWVLDGFREY